MVRRAVQDPAPAADSDLEGDETSVPASPPSPRDPSEVWAARAFWVAVVVAVPVIRHQARDQWFFLDEWDFLAARELTDPGDLLRPHNEHWTTLPIVAYRLLFRVVGLNHYWPYQAVVIGAHVAVAALLRAAMVRSRTDPWIATTLAGVLLVLGSGAPNITWGFQVTFTGALVLGLAHMLLADHDGGVRARDGIGLLAGFGALMCSGLGVALAVGVGASTLLRRGGRVAAAHTLPLAVVYVTWYLQFRPSPPGPEPTPTQVVTHARDQVSHAVVQLGQSRLWALVAVGLASIGAAVAVRRRPVRSPRGLLDLARAVPPLVAGTAVAGAAFTSATALGRAGLGVASQPTAPRYVSVVVGLALPLLGVTFSRLVAGRRWVRAGLLVFLVLGVPGNVAALHPSGEARYTTGAETAWRQRAALADEGEVARSVQPDAVEAPDVTMGWLADQVRTGRIDPAPSVAPEVRGDLDLAASLEVGAAPRRGACDIRTTEGPLTVGRGTQVRLLAPRARVSGGRRDVPPGSLALRGRGGLVLTARRGPLDLRITVPRGAADTLLVCGEG